jgi:hypothetical protein
MRVGPSCSPSPALATPAERTATPTNCAASVGADSNRLRHLLRLLRGKSLLAQDASTVSPEARCCKINVREQLRAARLCWSKIRADRFDRG